MDDRRRRTRNWIAVAAVFALFGVLLWIASIESTPVRHADGEHDVPVDAGERTAERVGTKRTRSEAASAEVEQPSAPARQAVWRISVVAEEEGSPIAGALVESVPGEGASAIVRATTDAAGRCELATDVLRKVSASAAGRMLRTVDVGPVAGRAYEFRLAAAGTVRGRVETPDGEPAAGVGVEMCSQSYTVHAAAVTDAQGRFAFPSWRVGGCGYVVAGRSSREWSTPRGWTWAPGRCEPFRTTADQPDRDVVVRLERRAVLVLDAVLPDGSPAEGTVDFRIVTPYGGSSSRCQKPHAELQVDPGRMAVSAATETGESEPEVLVVASGARVERTLVLRPSARIAGRIVAADGSPLPDVDIDFLDMPAIDGWTPRSSSLGTFRTDEDGRFEAKVGRPGQYVARVSPGNDAQPLRVVWTAPDENVLVRVASVSVRFTLIASDGEPTPTECRVSWSPGDERRFRSESHAQSQAGVFEIRVPPGRGRLIVAGRQSDLSFVVVDRVLDLGAASDLALGGLRIPPVRTIVGRVVLPHGVPAPALTWVSAFRRGEDRFVVLGGAEIVAADGAFEIPVRAGADTVLSCEVAGYAPAMVPVPVEEGSKGVTIRLERGGVARVRVTHSDGTPAADAQWRTEPWLVDGWSGIDADGVTSVRCLPGTVHMVVRGDDGAEITRDVLVVADRTTDVDVVLPR